jgi:hypothetical protein
MNGVVTIDLGPLQQRVKALRNGKSQMMQRVYKRWVMRYSRFARARFMKLSQGGADDKGKSWKPLAPSTIAARRNKKKSSIRILRDTGLLLQALTIGAKGNKIVYGSEGVAFGIVGGDRPGGKSIGDIARYHDTGGGRLPQREILVGPDQQTIAGMQSDLRDAVEKG